MFAVAAIAWMADCMDQQLFNLARVMSLTDLLGGAGADKDEVTKWAGRSTSVFLIGWATGGLIFGIFGDRLGRVKTLTLTILLYSIFTGLSALSQGPYDYCLYRFLTGLGVGGVFAAAVSLLAETMPSNARPFTLGLMQAMSAIGNITAALLFILIGLLGLYGHLDGLKSVGLNAWRVLFLIGIAPAVLVIFIQRRLKEPASWVHARDAAASGVGKKLGSYAELFGEAWIAQARHPGDAARLRRRGRVVGDRVLRGRSPAEDLHEDLQRGSGCAGALGQRTVGLHRRPEDHLGRRDVACDQCRARSSAWPGSRGWRARSAGRPAFAITIVAAAASVALVFMGMETRTDIIWMNVVMGICMLALFGGYAIYLPELFPTRLRATGTSFCYNVGRFIAASGPLMLGYPDNQRLRLCQGRGGEHAVPLRRAGDVLDLHPRPRRAAVPPRDEGQAAAGVTIRSPKVVVAAPSSVPEWLAKRAGAIQSGVDRETRFVLVGGEPLYKLEVRPASGDSRAR